MKYRGKLAKGAMMDKHKQEARGIVATINKTDSYWTCSQNEGDQLNLDLAWIPIADALRKRDAEIERLKAEIERLQRDLAIIGEMAVIDFDDVAVGKIDEALKRCANPINYREALDTFYKQYKDLK